MAGFFFEKKNSHILSPCSTCRGRSTRPVPPSPSPRTRTHSCSSGSRRKGDYRRSLRSHSRPPKHHPTQQHHHRSSSSSCSCSCHDSSRSRRTGTAFGRPGRLGDGSRSGTGTTSSSRRRPRRVRWGLIGELGRGCMILMRD